MFFIDQQRIKLNNGNYVINVVINDENQENDNNIIKHTKELYINYTNISLSDIQLLERYEKVDSINFLTKKVLIIYIQLH